MDFLTVDDFWQLATHSVLVRILVVHTKGTVAVTCYAYLITRNCLYVVAAEWENQGPAEVRVEHRASGDAIRQFLKDRLAIWSRPHSFVNVWAKKYWQAGLTVDHCWNRGQRVDENVVLDRFLEEVKQAAASQEIKRPSILKRCVRVWGGR